MKFTHQDLKITNSLYAVVNGVEIKSIDSSLESIKADAFSKALKYTDTDIENNEVNVGYSEILKEFGQETLIPAGKNVVILIRERNKFPTINTAVDCYNTVVVDSFLAIGAHDLDKVKGDIVFDYAKKWEKIPAVNTKNEYEVNETDYVYRDDEKILAWLDVRDTDLAKITNKTKNIVLVVEGNRKTTLEYNLTNLKRACELIIQYCGGKYEIRKVEGDELLASGEKNIIKSDVKIEKKEKQYFGLAKQIFDVAKMTVEHPSVEKFGDYAVRGEINFDDLDIVEKVDKVAGFSNLWVKENVLIDVASNILNDDYKKELGEIGKSKTVVIDYSAPNIAKPFGIGHLRSTNIGQAIYNTYQVLGWKCIGVNHLGDWGTQFGKLIVAIKKWWDKDLNELTIDELEKLYIKFHSESKSDESLIEQGREWFEKLENGDVEAKNIWQICIDKSIAEFDRVYKELGVKIDYALGESFYLDKMASVVKTMEDKKLLTVSEGAKIVEFESMPPAMVMKTNGTTTYLTRDLATIKYRVETWNPDLFIYEVGSDQILHFRQLFETAKKLGYSQEFVHVAHGLIRWKDGKFSTRKGDTIHLSDIIDKAIEMAKKMAPENDEESIKKVAIGAVKFNDLASDPKKDVVFDWDRVMSMEGNSAPYLQYTFARAKSVLSKSQKTNLQFPNNENFDENELPLLRYFYIFEEKIVEAGERYSPAVLAEYLLNLARKYNEFYAKCKIIGEAEESRRIFLTQVTAKIIKDGLAILGIETLEKM